jgi:hypothetical protein
LLLDGFDDAVLFGERREGEGQLFHGPRRQVLYGD